MMFPEPEKTLATCEADSCDGCAVDQDLHCHFGFKDWINFIFISIPPFLLGGYGITRVNPWFLAPWLVFVFAFFGFIEIRVMCSHCPHYAEDLKSLKCWANYGPPKIRKYSPGPMSLIEKTVFFGGFAIVWGYPLVFLFLGPQLFLVLVYSMTTIGFFMTLLNFMCSRCINFACPLNRVDQKVRENFFKKNPAVAEAWKKTASGSE